jgi:hypothetical protein
MGASMATAGVQPVVSRTSSLEIAIIAGITARRSDITVTLPMPPAPIAIKTTLAPSAVTLTAETWLATAPFEKYVPLLTKLNELNLIGGFGNLAAPGLIMRQVLRGPMFGSQQLEMVVTKISEEPAPAGAFEIPADYTQVPAPIK